VKQIIGSIKSVFRKEGFFRGLFIIPLKIIQYLYFKVFRRSSFTVAGKSYPYFYHLRNATFLKERAVEVAIGIDLFKAYRDKQVLEVGNVMNQYYTIPHDIVDKYEKNDGVKNQDIIDYNPDKKYDLILTISTIEHVGWDETPRTKDKFKIAIEHLKQLLAPGGLLYFSIPLAYNEDIDASLEKSEFPVEDIHFMKKTSRFCKWIEVAYNEVKDSKFDMNYLRANALLIGYFKKA